MSYIQDSDLKSLILNQGVTVWSESQTTLENQALHELNVLTQEEIEDGEVIEVTKKEVVSTPLDINIYLKRQEELRKIQEYKRTLKDDDCKAKTIADKISLKYRKRKQEDVPKQIKIAKTVTERSNSDSEYLPSDDEIESDTEQVINIRKRNLSISGSTEKIKDDGCFNLFKARLEEYYNKLEMEKDDEPENIDFYTIKGGLKIPIKIWSNLYTYQQEGVRWMWGIHRHSSGGILGDEMGLGKTVQIIAFLAGLEYSQVISNGRFKGLGPTLIVCPVTVIHQWVKHFHEWAPEFRVAILHQTGTFQGKKSHLIKDIVKIKGILISSYSGVLKYKDSLSQCDWHYMILDEGHKIRNPNAKVSMAVKEIKMQHRLMLTGSPMQNNLQELWSLFDFTNPGLLGNLNTFMEHFNNPIIQGGFSNSTSLQEATALSVATTLKNVITPFLLRRSKDEVQHHINLPDKSEQVLFCSLTDEQYDLYKGYLMSDHIGSILGKDSRNWFAHNHAKANVFVALTAMRKICNHPDIYLHDAGEPEEEDINIPEKQIGFYKKSGKMIVVSALLKIWKKQKHRILLFTQSRAMVKIFENFLSEHEYKYLKMDGSTSVNSRQPLINKFNEDSSYDVFLLTTKVGGLGVNLTGADRVIIYDPDWNPATDTQARERAWRIGQDKNVTIYRLLSAGTIEEKMYQRQVWKQLLSNKILIDPKTHKIFKSTSLHDLFSLPENKTNPETTNIFRESRVKIQEMIEEKKKKSKSKNEVQFSEDKIQAMRKLAHEIAKNISKPQDNVKKSSYQIQLEEERQHKLEARQEQKKLTPLELRQANRKKAEEKAESRGNTVDDCESQLTFESALEYSAKSSKAYHQLKGDRDLKSRELNKKFKKSEKKAVVDESGMVDGEKVDGLVKSESRSTEDTFEGESGCQDQYILEKLFARKGVSGALQHDSVVNSGVRHGLKVQTEAQLKADRALQALRKSRLDNWSW